MKALFHMIMKICYHYANIRLNSSLDLHSYDCGYTQLNPFHVFLIEKKRKRETYKFVTLIIGWVRWERACLEYFSPTLCLTPHIFLAVPVSSHNLSLPVILYQKLAWNLGKTSVSFPEIVFWNSSCSVSPRKLRIDLDATTTKKLSPTNDSFVVLINSLICVILSQQSVAFWGKFFSLWQYKFSYKELQNTKI